MVDLTTVDHLGSSGLGALLNLQQQCAERDCDLRIVCPEKTPSRRIVEVTSLSDVFECYDDLESALQSIREEPPAIEPDLVEAIKSLLEEIQDIKERLARVEEKLS